MWTILTESYRPVIRAVSWALDEIARDGLVQDRYGRVPPLSGLCPHQHATCNVTHNTYIHHDTCTMLAQALTRTNIVEEDTHFPVVFIMSLLNRCLLRVWDG